MTAWRTHFTAAPLGALAVLALASSGCLVLKKDFDQCVSDAAGYRAAAEAKQKDDAGALLAVQERLTAAESTTQDRDSKLADLSTASHNLQAQLDEATAINQQLRGELQRLGKDVDKVLADKGTLAKALDDAKTRLDELRKAQAAAEARTLLFKDFGLRFKSLVDAGQLRVETRRGQLVVEVTGDLLFDPGHTDVRPVGKGVLLEIARALQTASPPPRRFLVTDHVDDEPPKSKHAKSLWELTAMRAAAAVELLVSVGVPPGSLAAAGAGSSDPLVANDTPADRAKNRRLEIALLPGPDETLAMH
ncbi:MAG TPA: OmpA family protein [Polyangiaceae bacterium]